MSKGIKENPLIFDFGSGKKVTIYSNCDEWYLEDPEGKTGKGKYYLNNDWFYQTLKNNEFGIYKFASIFNYECNFERGEKFIKKYAKEFDDNVGNGNMDVHIFMMEVFAQSATKNENLHWW